MALQKPWGGAANKNNNCLLFNNFDFLEYIIIYIYKLDYE